MLFRANATMSGYDTLHVDSLKYMEQSYPGQVFNVEVYAADPEANVSYKFDSKFDSTTSFGKMKGRQVGLEYMGSDHKSILLSFPLYYLDTNDARTFLHFVINNKFGNPLGVSHSNPPSYFGLKVFPNPVKNTCNVTFTLDKPGQVRLSLLSVTGKRVATWLDRKMEAGFQFLTFSTQTLSPGLYEVVLENEGKSAVKKVIRVQ